MSISESILLTLAVIAAILAVAKELSVSSLLILDVIAAILAVARVISTSRESNLVAIELDTDVIEPLIIVLVVVPKVTPVISPLSISTLVISWSPKSIAPPAVNAPISSAVNVPATVTEPVIDKLELTESEPVNEWWSSLESPKLFEPVATDIEDEINVV